MTHNVRNPTLSAMRVTGAVTHYPTGGQIDEGALGGTATQGNSIFATSGAPTVANRKSGNIVRLVATKVTAAAATVSIESHNGGTVIQRIRVPGDDTVSVELGLETKAGWRVVGAADVDVTVLYSY